MVDDFLDGYAGGATPNPCVRCNGLVRFDRMLALASRLGAERLVTGHYARIAHDAEGPLVRAGADPAKDQSYVLARLTGDELERLRFPLGHLDKPRVRELGRRRRAAGGAQAREPGPLLPRRHRRAGGLHGPPRGAPPGTGTAALRRGDIVDREGRVLGRHRGHHRFTVGQRRGIGVAAPEPLYVLAKDAVRNRVVVGPRAGLAARQVAVAPARLHRPAAAADSVRLRYHSPAVACDVASPGRRGAGARGPSGACPAPGSRGARAGARPDRVPDARRPRGGVGDDRRCLST